jgi:Na+/phosphate symporter
VDCFEIVVSALIQSSKASTTLMAQSLAGINRFG